MKWKRKNENIRIEIRGTQTVKRIVSVPGHILAYFFKNKSNIQKEEM